MKNIHDITRRDFIKATGVTATGFAAQSLFERRVTGEVVNNSPIGRIVGANDRIIYGIVGVGGMGGGHLRILKDLSEKENLSIRAVCDVFEKRRRAASAAAGIPETQSFVDYRRLLDDKEIDVIVIATPDHWHARIGIDAMEAGKHIYVEKPLTRTLDEAFKLWEKAKETRRLVQVGAHGCSDPKWHKARDVVKSGRLGRILWAQGSYCRNNPKGEWNYGIDPDANEQTVDWRMWLGKAPKRAWSPERYFRWRKYWDYANGIIGDLWPHRLHPLMLALGLNEFPSSVACMGGVLCDSDKGNGEPRDVADTTMVMVEFPCGTMIHLAGSTVNERGIEDLIRGQKANLLFGGGKVQLQPERPFVDEVEAKDETPPDSGESHAKHQKNFIDSLRFDRIPNCDIELGVRVQTIVSMAELSYRKGKMVRFDSNKLRVV
jgi:predicted dehydrogenase